MPDITVDIERLADGRFRFELHSDGTRIEEESSPGDPTYGALCVLDRIVEAPTAVRNLEERALARLYQLCTVQDVASMRRPPRRVAGDDTTKRQKKAS